MTAWLKITLRRSRIGATLRQRNALQGLGLGRIDSSVIRPDTPAIRGQIDRVAHLVDVRPEAAPAAASQPRKGERA